MVEVMVPDGLPSLARGAHGPREGQACVMELISVLAGEEWSDHPKCVHPMLAEAAIHVNDAVPDNMRHLIVPFIGRLFNTNDNRVTAPLKEYLTGGGPRWWMIRNDEVVRTSFMALVGGKYVACPCCTEVDAATVAVLVRWLDRAIAVAEKAIGDKAPRVITQREAERAAEVVAAR